MEVLEREENFRYTAYPVMYNDLYEMYRKLQDNTWFPSEIKENLSVDVKNWKQLDVNVQSYIKMVVAFFAVSDSAVIETIDEEIENRIKIREAKMWYNCQKANEDVHSEVYSMLCETYVEDPEERKTVFEAVKNFPSISKKIDWIHKWVGGENKFRHLDDETQQTLKIIAKTFQNSLGDFLHCIGYDTELDDPKAPIPKLDHVINSIVNCGRVPLGQIILANCILEGVFFSSSFASIFWVNHYFKGLLPGLASANSWISRDEGMHTDFAILLYRKYIKNKPTETTVRTMFKDAISVEDDFIDSCLPTNLKGMNATLMKQYVRFVADQLLLDLGYSIIFGDKNPFEFMSKQSIGVRIPDFFIDTNSAEYKLPTNNGLRFDDNF